MRGGARRAPGRVAAREPRRRRALVPRPRDAPRRRPSATGSRAAARSRACARRPRPTSATDSFRSGRISPRAASFGIGSDSNVSLSPVEELRWLEYGQRLLTRRRIVAAGVPGASCGETLWAAAARGGARACGRRRGRDRARPARGPGRARGRRRSPRAAGELLDRYVFASERAAPRARDGRRPLARRAFALDAAPTRARDEVGSSRSMQYRLRELAHPGRMSAAEAKPSRRGDPGEHLARGARSVARRRMGTFRGAARRLRAARARAARRRRAAARARHAAGRPARPRARRARRRAPSSPARPTSG